MADNLIYNKSFEFAIMVVNYYKVMKTKENVLSKQLLRSGTSIGANVSEALLAQSKKDFISKMNIALKEAKESEYWIKLLKATGYLEDEKILEECTCIIRILVSIVKTSNQNR